MPSSGCMYIYITTYYYCCISYFFCCTVSAVHVSATANTVIIEEGNDVTLSCILTGYLPINYEITWMDSSGMAPSHGVIANGVNTQFRSQRGSTSTSPAVQSNLSL